MVSPPGRLFPGLLTKLALDYHLLREASLTALSKAATSLLSPSSVRFYTQGFISTRHYVLFYLLLSLSPIEQKCQKRRGVFYVALVVTVYPTFSGPEEPSRERNWMEKNNWSPHLIWWVVPSLPLRCLILGTSKGPFSFNLLEFYNLCVVHETTCDAETPKKQHG